MGESLARFSLEEWQNLVDSQSDATPFHHQNWIKLIAEQYRLRIEIPALIQDGTVTALPFIETRSITGRRKLVSLPFTDCMRIITTDASKITTFLAALQEDSFCKGRPVLVKTDQALDCPLQPQVSFRHELPLVGSVDDIVAAYRPSLRRNLRHADCRSLRYERCHDVAALEDFYRLHTLTRRRLGVPVQPKAFFRRLLDRMIKPGLGAIGVVFDGRSAVAAAVLLELNGTVLYKYGASDPKALNLRPNDFLFDQAIRQAFDQGFRRFDFGVTAHSEAGLRRFKRKWGSTETTVSCYAVSGPIPVSVRDSRFLRLASTMIRKSPTFVCRALGGSFYKYSQ